MPITNPQVTQQSPAPVRSSGTRFYIVKDHEHAVVRTVPVGVCAAPPRVALHASGLDGAAEYGPTCPAPVPARVGERHGLAERVQRVREVVRHPLGGGRLGR